MNNQHYKAIKTVFGIIRGRDAIILSDFRFNPIGANILTIHGDINGSLSTNAEYKTKL